MKANLLSFSTCVLLLRCEGDVRSAFRNEIEISNSDNPLFDKMPETCKRDNWGLPEQTDVTPYFRDYETEIRIPCQQQWGSHSKPFSDLAPMATTLWYKDTQDYDNMIAVDLVPENKDLYHTGSSWGQSYRTDFKKFQPKSLMASTCSGESKEVVKGGTIPKWEITRLGPFRTQGGYDWMQIGWDNIWDFESKLKDHPEGIYVLDQYMSPVYENGTNIDHPPIHIHRKLPQKHINIQVLTFYFVILIDMHIGPAPYVRYRTSSVGCVLFGSSCFDPLRAMEHHGDYLCFNKEGGMNCRLESAPQGYAKLVSEHAYFRSSSLQNNNRCIFVVYTIYLRSVHPSVSRGR